MSALLNWRTWAALVIVLALAATHWYASRSCTPVRAAASSVRAVAVVNRIEYSTMSRPALVPIEFHGTALYAAAIDGVLVMLKPGDLLVVYKLDRLARSLQHLLSILEALL